MVSIALIGPGALGGVVAAWLAQNREIGVTICARTPLSGLRVKTPDKIITANPRVLLDPGEALPVDWVLVATKVYDVASTRPWLRHLVSAETRVAILQNGVEHVERFAPFVPMAQIVPAVVDIPAARTGPGRMEQHRDGTIFVPEGRNGEDFVALFAHTPIAAATTDDWRSRVWAKLCLNSAGAVSTLTLEATGPVWTPELEAVIRAVVEECAAVGRAEGAIIDPSVIERVVEGQSTSRPGTTNSMQDDRAAGRPMEIDARNGVIVRLGKKHGIPTPMNALLVTLLEASVSRS